MPDALPLSVFLSYSPQDGEWPPLLEAHLTTLERENSISIWHQRKLLPGAPRTGISDHLATADIVLLLISSDFLASDYCYAEEMRCALERHERGEAQVIPLLIRACDFTDAPFDGLQVLPRNGQPLATQDADTVLAEVAGEIRAVVAKLRAGPPPPEPEPRFTDERTRDLTHRLEDARGRLEEITVSGGDTHAAQDEILDLRRRLRDAGLQPGYVLEHRFRLIEKIGRGGFATVWKAFDRQRREMVAVKVLHTQYAEDASRRERFFRGARKMAELHHQGVVRVIEGEGHDARFHFFVMELVDDGDLNRAVLAGRFSPRERLGLVLDVGEALAFAHERDVIHRDVKPANILIDAAGRARLTDFDLVRAQDTTGGTRTGMMGTVVYAAPEMMRSAKDAGATADVFGLGMTAVFTLYGRELPLDVLRDAPKFVAGLDASPEIRDVLARAVAWEPEERTSSMMAFCDELRVSLAPVAPVHTHLAGTTAQHPPAEPTEPFQTIVTSEDGRVELWREIPAGTFMMGSPKGEGHSDERPQHRVTIQRPFRMSVVPMTNAHFAAFDPKHRPHVWKGVPEEELDRHPVVKVTWHRAMEFCDWLAASFSWAEGARLPTEEEWEYACRAGTKTYYWSGNSEEDLARVGWYGEGSGGTPHRVGEKPANPWGLYDMHGNVWEWTLSPWRSDYSADREDVEVDPAAVDPAKFAAASSGRRVARGGSCWDVADRTRSACRDHWNPETEFQNQGFRVVLPLSAAPSS